MSVVESLLMSEIADYNRRVTSRVLSEGELKGRDGFMFACGMVAMGASFPGDNDRLQTDIEICSEHYRLASEKSKTVCDGAVRREDLAAVNERVARYIIERIMWTEADDE